MDTNTTTTANEWSGGIGVYDNGSQATIGNRFVNNTLASLYERNNGGVSTAICIGGTYQNSALVFMNNLVIGCSNAIGPESVMIYTGPTKSLNMQYNDFFSKATTDTTMGMNNGSYSYSTVANFNPGVGTYANNSQVSPGFTGGSKPSGFDSAWHPNTTYFALSSSSPASVQSTGNSILGDSTHGFNHASNKFSYDIAGNSRSGWSMGAYEFGSGTTPAPTPPPAPTGLHVVLSSP